MWPTLPLLLTRMHSSWILEVGVMSSLCLMYCTDFLCNIPMVEVVNDFLFWLCSMYCHRYPFLFIFFHHLLTTCDVLFHSKCSYILWRTCFLLFQPGCKIYIKGNYRICWCHGHSFFSEIRLKNLLCVLEDEGQVFCRPMLTPEEDYLC